MNSAAQDERACLHAVVSGRVQGVGFRAWTKSLCEQHSCTGWVRNCPDGTVELQAEGATEQLQKVFQRLHQGPSLAKVMKVQHSFAAFEGESESFVIRFS